MSKEPREKVSLKKELSEAKVRIDEQEQSLAIALNECGMDNSCCYDYSDLLSLLKNKVSQLKHSHDYHMNENQSLKDENKKFREALMKYKKEAEMMADHEGIPHYISIAHEALTQKAEE